MKQTPFVRIHMRVVVMKDFIVPDKAILLPATHADQTQMDELIDIDPDAFYLFDRGYLDYKKFDRYRLENVRFITRLKKNAKVEMLSEQAPDPENLIFRDAEIHLGSEQNVMKMQHPLRIIETEDQEKKSCCHRDRLFRSFSQGDRGSLSLSSEN